MSNKAEIISEIERIGVLPVIRADSLEEARAVIEAVRAGGISIIEVTMTVPGAVDLIRNCRTGGPARRRGYGARPETAAECVDAGARFIISPALNLDTMHFAANIRWW